MEAIQTTPQRNAVTQWLGLFLALLALVVALQILHLPQSLDYSAFAFGEPGANLNVVYLIRHGLRPGIDFGHSYGLLGILALDFWFRVMGLTPIAYVALICLLDTLIIAVIAEFIRTAKLSPFRTFFLFVSLPIFLWVNYFNIAHPIETLCLLAAITAHLKARYDLALSAVAASVLARPALGYVYGAFLVVVVLVRMFHARTHARAQIHCVCVAVRFNRMSRNSSGVAIRTLFIPANGLAWCWNGKLSAAELWFFPTRHGVLVAFAF